MRRAVSAYFRAASALGSASLMVRHAALLLTDDEDRGHEHERDDDFLFDRAATYHRKALLMSRSAAALLGHAEDWFEELGDPEEDIDSVLAHFAVKIEGAADASGEVVAALERASFADLDDYPQLLEGLRGALQFLNSEAAAFRALAAGELDSSGDLDAGTVERLDEESVEQAGASATARRSGMPLFDRRVRDELLDALSPGGVFSWVTELARQPISPDSPPLDLGLRANPKAPGEAHAKLYLGTTHVLAVHIRADGLFRLECHKRDGLFKDVAVGFDDRWAEWQPLDRLVEPMSRIREHVDAAIAAAPPGRQVEGLYQAALAKPTHAGFALVDREVAFHFWTNPDKLDTKGALRSSLVTAQRALATAHPWARGAPPPGDKLDALAIDRGGRLLAIEVKPGMKSKSKSASKALKNTPIQVAMYVRMLRAWVDASEVFAREVLEGMAAQRAALGLNDRQAAQLRDPIEIVPVIAVGKPVVERHEVHDHIELVRDALRAVGEPLTGLEFWAIEETGLISLSDATCLNARFG